MILIFPSIGENVNIKSLSSIHMHVKLVAIAIR